MESDDESLLSPTSSTSSFDEDDVNVRMAPNWCAYRQLIESRGTRLDTCADVKQWYQDYWESLIAQGCKVTRDLPGYTRACSYSDENELCKDAGLPDNLFRGTHCATGKKVVIKAVHIYSREYDTVRYLSSPPLRNHPMNHTIPILDLIDDAANNLGFIVMEEWSPQLVSDVPRTLRLFLGAIRQCIEVRSFSPYRTYTGILMLISQHAVFMHAHHMAHLDISIRNLLTDYSSHYAYIDFETCRRFDGIPSPRVRGVRGTNLPPELENGEYADPYKVDIWALGVLILHASALTGYDVPELKALTRPMLHEDFERRPTASAVLKVFDTIVAGIKESRLQSTSVYHSST
ncbi:hypothetical protein NM688_g541 [Phlebia brevispora]|uniref:Uncharacterized protein n=1 Tax=Phlebia brevispora TaxID=194682 RepID=A0ACC1TEA7_9APHY|nr:hypothetical protein NM688_g541 [Phlebia brevispora]